MSPESRPPVVKPKVNGMHKVSRIISLTILITGMLIADRAATAATEVRLDRDFMAGVAEKLPPSPFEKKGQYRGKIHSYRLLAIDPKRRRLLATCQVEGEFRPPVSGPISERVSRSDDHTKGLRKFGFEIRTGINIEAGPDATPKVRVEVDQIKKTELEGFAGLLAKLLGKYFDEMITQIADGRASLLSQKLNAEILKQAARFKEYGAFCGIDYTAGQIVLRFDLTTFRREGTVGYVFAAPGQGTVPLYRWFDHRVGSHYYTTSPGGPDRPGFQSEGIVGHVFDHAVPGTLPIYGWHGRRDHLYTPSSDGEGLARRGFRTEGIAFYLCANPDPSTVPLYRFFDARRGLHFYTTHPHAEFAK
jgi:hypothetical protein